MQKRLKERIFYLDFVRTVAVFLIIITHYNAYFLLSGGTGGKYVITEYPFGIYVGDLGVSLFLIISGAALMYTYGDEGKLDFKLFYKKRFLSIYPMFWIAYIVAALPKLSVWRSLGRAFPNWKFIFTLIGMDGYLSEYVDGFYVIGEWFLGFIIIFYVIFPVLRWLIVKNEAVLWIAVLTLYVLTLRFCDLRMPLSKVIFARLPELCFGMSFIKHQKKLKWYHTLPFIAILVANTAIRPPFSSTLQTSYVGISFFLILVFISYYINRGFINNICSFTSKYSYAVFLVHHVIIEYIQGGVGMEQLSLPGSYALFAVTVAVILITAVLLNASSKYVMDAINKKICRN